ncbi:hypothetical protein OESDEN_01379 [Oesophagostomum dentatum]|uniref:Uncharacterized protein n=1 Tax=Oesophagostomum dentatum TaxID=61180 RepID=A0A0B1TS67_OESDE|nr:hypothetical protein OESDEN_01379 [Oesophagostomum dentatum]
MSTAQGPSVPQPAPPSYNEALSSPAAPPPMQQGPPKDTGFLVLSLEMFPSLKRDDDPPPAPQPQVVYAQGGVAYTVNPQPVIVPTNVIIIKNAYTFHPYPEYCPKCQSNVSFASLFMWTPRRSAEQAKQQRYYKKGCPRDDRHYAARVGFWFLRLHNSDTGFVYTATVANTNPLKHEEALTWKVAFRSPHINFAACGQCYSDGRRFWPTVHVYCRYGLEALELANIGLGINDLLFG